MAKNILDMVIWHPEMEIGRCEITYLHRGSPGNLKSVDGYMIDRLERGFLILNDGTQIPFHRIVKIEYDEDIIWKK
ncbi:MAG: DUF504 domain-containing protein [Euryarchaeota archaeon]|nr:DUF504 domain-containing protein [Euryarchaeota archaeon]